MSISGSPGAAALGLALLDRRRHDAVADVVLVASRRPCASGTPGVGAPARGPRYAGELIDERGRSCRSRATPASSLAVARILACARSTSPMFSAAASLTRRPPHPSAATSARRPVVERRAATAFGLQVEVDRGRGRDPEPGWRSGRARTVSSLVAQVAAPFGAAARSGVLGSQRFAHADLAGGQDQRLELVGLEDRAPMRRPYPQPRPRSTAGLCGSQPRRHGPGDSEHLRARSTEDLLIEAFDSEGLPLSAPVEGSRSRSPASDRRDDQHAALVQLVLHERLDHLVGRSLAQIR